MTRARSELPNSEAARLAHASPHAGWARARAHRQCADGHDIGAGQIYFAAWGDEPNITRLCRPCADAPAKPGEE